MLTENDIQSQSEMVWKTWRKKWLTNCAINKEIIRVPLKSLIDECKNEPIIHCAFGHSLSKNLETIKKYQDRIKIICCDKAFGYLMDNGITPTYCLIADASVSGEWHGNHDTSKTTLIANITCNPTWTTAWKGRICFYLNWDNIGTQYPLAKAFGAHEVIPASSNVSNAMVVLSAQVLNPSIHLLVGFDYSWSKDGLYYASGDSDKRYYMRHMDVISPFTGDNVYSSSNLVFSRNWLMQYLMKYSKIKAVNCSEEGIFDIEMKMPLEKAINKFMIKET